MTESFTENEIAAAIISHAIDIHKALGPGMLESVYKECLFYRLTKDGFFVQKELPVPVIFEEVSLECGFRADLVVNKKVVVELKTVEALNEVHFAQTLTNLKFTTCKLGLLMNFRVALMKHGIRRIVNGL